MDFPSRDDEFDFTVTGPCGPLIEVCMSDPIVVARHYKEAIRRATAQRLVGDVQSARDWRDVVDYFRRRFNLE